MSVINVTKMWSKTGGTFASDKFYTYANKIGITEGYQVLAEPGDDVSVIESAAGLPRHGDQHSSGRWAFVNSITPSPLGPFFWLVIIGYEGDDSSSVIDIEWTDTTSSEPIDRDFNGKAIVTKNNEQVEGLTMEISDPVLIVRRKMDEVNLYSIGAYRHATNSDSFWGWPPGTARLVGYSAKNQFIFGDVREQWDVTARIQFRYPLAGATSEKAWYKRWRHEGLYVWNPLGGGTRRALDDMGQEVTKPVLLNQIGERETDPSAAIFIYSQVYDSLPYVGLGLF